MDFAEQLGKRMRRVRNERGITQSELAMAAGVGANYIPRLERGEMVPSVEAAYRIARALGMSLDELCGRGERRRDTEELSEALAKLTKADASVLRRVAEAIELVGADRKSRRSGR